MTGFLHTLHPSSVLFSFGPISIHWYGAIIVLGIFCGLLVALRLTKLYNIKSEQVFDLAFYLVLFSVLGARIYAVLLFWDFYLQNPLEIFMVWHGGLAIHGAIIGGVITLFFYARRHKLDFWLWADILAPALALGQAIGRWGNYFNQEVFGAPTNLPWGIPIDLANRPAGFENFEYFQPTFLYESILNLLVFLILIGIHLVRIKKLSAKSYQLKAGNITLLYLVLYSLVRIFMEQFRIDTTPILLGVRIPIIVSVVIILIAVGIYITKSKKKNAA